MKFLRIMRVTFIFLVSLFIVSIAYLFIISLLQNRLLKLSELPNVYLFMMGYGDSINDNKVVLILLAIIGIISISLLTAYLTMYFVRRTKDVKISNNVYIKREIQDYFLCFRIVNKGDAIYHVKFSLMLHEKNLDDPDIDSLIYHIENNYPLFKKHSTRIIKYKIDDEIYKNFRGFFINKNESIYLVSYLEFTDNYTGQESHILNTHEMNNFQNIRFPKIDSWNNYTLLDNQDDDNLKRAFMRWLKLKEKHFNLRDARPVNSEAIHLYKNNEESSLKAHVHFTKMKDTPPFTMALLLFEAPYQNWTDHYESNAIFSFEIKGESLTRIRLEIKDDKKDHVIDETVEVTGEFTYWPFTISKYSELSKFEKISEICFTVYPDFFVNPKQTEGEFIIRNCKLGLPQESNDEQLFSEKKEGNMLV